MDKLYNGELENYTLGFPNQEIEQGFMKFILPFMLLSFKLNGSAEEAISQINTKGYASPFAKDGHKVIKVGINLLQIDHILFLLHFVVLYTIVKSHHLTDKQEDKGKVKDDFFLQSVYAISILQIP